MQRFRVERYVHVTYDTLSLLATRTRGAVSIGKRRLSLQFSTSHFETATVHAQYGSEKTKPTSEIGVEGVDEYDTLRKVDGVLIVVLLPRVR